MATQSNRWILGARPKTLPASIVPVLIGAGCAVGLGDTTWWRLVPAMIVSLALQVGVNYANDYSDGVKGTDEGRVGPTRLVASGLATAREVKLAAFSAFGIAALAGLLLALTTSMWLIPVGIACIAAGWFYTGGPSPYGYAGLGEVFVFVFFGLLATAGTTYAITTDVSALALVTGAETGFLACALLVINNLRDIPTDKVSGKRTLAVRLGDRTTRGLFVAIIAVAAMCNLISGLARPLSFVALIGFVFARAPIKEVRAGAMGQRLIPVLAMTARLQLIVGLLLAAGLALN
jgi:1,4-dihydroxy-2-naphthoate polyprenyltransferase